MEQKREEDTEAHLNGLWILDKGAKAIQWGKGGLFNKWC